MRRIKRVLAVSLTLAVGSFLLVSSSAAQPEGYWGIRDDGFPAACFISCGSCGPSCIPWCACWNAPPITCTPSGCS